MNPHWVQSIKVIYLAHPQKNPCPFSALPLFATFLRPCMGMRFVPFFSIRWSGQKFSTLKRHRTWQGTVPETWLKSMGACCTSAQRCIHCNVLAQCTVATQRERSIVAEPEGGLLGLEPPTLPADACFTHFKHVCVHVLSLRVHAFHCHINSLSTWKNYCSYLHKCVCTPCINEFRPGNQCV